MVAASFILAGIVYAITCAVSLGLAMSPGFKAAPDDRPTGALPIFVVGTLISAAIAGSHYMHVEW